MTAANRVTIVRAALVPVFLALLFVNFPYAQWVALGVFLVAACTDWLDGYLARRMNQVTNFGKFMDPIADKLLVISAFIVLTGLGKMHPLVCVVFVAREFIVQGMRMVAASNRTVVAAGYLGKIKTVAQIVLVCILIVDNYPFSLVGLPMDAIALWVAMVFTVLSAVEYLVQNKRFLRMGVDA